MSGHERERLSAYLDGELAPAERAAVAAHLDACGECQARLAELGAADEAAAALPLEAPAGYFESFPARVRARLEPRPARRARRLPAWTWAAAAALLLAVVTPLTLLRRPHMAPSVPPGESRAAPVAAREARQAASPAPAAGRDELAKLAPAAGRPTAAPPSPAAPPPPKREATFAAPPSEPDTRALDSAAGTPAPHAVAASAAAAPETMAAEAEADVAALADAARPREAAAGPARNQAATFEERKAVRKDEAAPPEEARGRAAAAPAAAAPAGGPPLAAGLLAADPEWQRLDAARPRTAAGLRALREEWRAFADRDPKGPLADAARVRAIEAALAAWRVSLDPRDEAQLRKDVAAYLERDDAAQKERVRALAGPERR
jgi:hypothetical protein